MAQQEVQQLATDLSQAYDNVKTEALKLERFVKANSIEADFSALLAALDGLGPHVQRVGTMYEVKQDEDDDSSDEQEDRATTTAVNYEATSSPDAA